MSESQTSVPPDKSANSWIDAEDDVGPVEHRLATVMPLHDVQDWSLLQRTVHVLAEPPRHEPRLPAPEVAVWFAERAAGLQPGTSGRPWWDNTSEPDAPRIERYRPGPSQPPIPPANVAADVAADGVAGGSEQPLKPPVRGPAADIARAAPRKPAGEPADALLRPIAWSLPVAPEPKAPKAFDPAGVPFPLPDTPATPPLANRLVAQPGVEPMGGGRPTVAEPGAAKPPAGAPVMRGIELKRPGTRAEARPTGAIVEKPSPDLAAAAGPTDTEPAAERTPPTTWLTGLQAPAGTTSDARRPGGLFARDRSIPAEPGAEAAIPPALAEDPATTRAGALFSGRRPAVPASAAEQAATSAANEVLSSLRNGASEGVAPRPGRSRESDEPLPLLFPKEPFADAPEAKEPEAEAPEAKEPVTKEWGTKEPAAREFGFASMPPSSARLASSARGGLPVSAEQRRRRPRGLVLVLLAGSALVVIGAAFWWLNPFGEPAVSGLVTAPKVTVVAPADGRIAQIMVSNGVRVQPDSELMVIDAPPPDDRKRADLTARLDNAHQRSDRLDKQIIEMNAILDDLRARAPDPTGTRQQSEIRLRLIDMKVQKDSATGEARELEQNLANEAARPHGPQPVKAGLDGLVWSIAAIDGIDTVRGMPLVELADCAHLTITVARRSDGAEWLPGSTVRVRVGGTGPLLNGMLRLGRGSMTSGAASDTGAAQGLLAAGLQVELSPAERGKLASACPVGKSVAIFRN